MNREEQIRKGFERAKEREETERKNINKGKVGNPYGVKNAEELIDLFLDYARERKRERIIDNVPVQIDAPLTIGGFCLFCGHSAVWLTNLIATIEAKDKDKRTDLETELLRSATRVRDACRDDLLQGGLEGNYMQQVVVRVLGLAEKTENKTENSMSEDTRRLYEKYLERVNGTKEQGG